tara:strand:+ start:623 stop:946 length:324 start_codon:yes stop_codon:yes gene_type:complete
MVIPFDPDKVGDPNKKVRRGRRSGRNGSMSMSPQRGSGGGGGSVENSNQDIGYGGYDAGFGNGANGQDQSYGSPYGQGGGYDTMGDQQYGGGSGQYEQRPGGARGRR